MLEVSAGLFLGADNNLAPIAASTVEDIKNCGNVGKQELKQEDVCGRAEFLCFAAQFISGDAKPDFIHLISHAFRDLLVFAKAAGPREGKTAVAGNRKGEGKDGEKM